MRPRIRGLQLDHAGPLYHALLQTARYDGSFCTGTAAAALLAELAMPPGWGAAGGAWADADRLSGLKVCDPACGTGTLLMAAARTVEQRFRLAGGDEDDLPVLAEAIRKALDCDNGELARYGAVDWRSPERLRGRPWNAACFRHRGLADACDELLDNRALGALGDPAAVVPLPTVHAGSGCRPRYAGLDGWRKRKDAAWQAPRRTTASSRCSATAFSGRISRRRT